MRRPSIYAAPLLLTACTHSPPATICQLQNPNTLAAYAVHHGPAIMTGVNTTPALLLFDTGAVMSSLSPALAQAAQLSNVTETSITAGGLAGQVTAEKFEASQFTVGNATASNFDFMVFNEPENETKIMGNGADGILGENVIKNYDVDFDLPDNRITLYVVSPCTSLTPPFSRPVSTAPIQVDFWGNIMVPITLDGHTQTALLDTGAGISAIPQTLFDAWDLAASAKKLGKLNLAAIGGMISTNVYRFHTLTVAGLTIQNPIAAVITQGTKRDAKLEEEEKREDDQAAPKQPAFYTFDPTINLVLGETFLATHRLFISHATNTLYVQQ